MLRQLNTAAEDPGLFLIGLVLHWPSAILFLV
jgi:hypothetical protein